MIAGARVAIPAASVHEGGEDERDMLIVETSNRLTCIRCNCAIASREYEELAAEQETG